MRDGITSEAAGWAVRRPRQKLVSWGDATFPFGCACSYLAVTRRQRLPFQKPDRAVLFADPAGPAWPTATQSVADRQVTSWNKLALPLPGAGTPVAVQVLPFQVTAAALSVLTPFGGYNTISPTATQRFTAGQETPDRSELFVPPPGNGTVASRQLVPFQISLKLTVAVEYIPKPTTTQLRANGQDTPVCPAPMSPGQGAPFRADQTLPFHDSITATGGPSTDAVATQRTRDAHETALRPLSAKPPTEAGGVAWVHVFPFQISASGAPAWSPAWYAPTATQLVADLHDTPTSEAFVPAGAGSCSGVHALPFQMPASANPRPSLP